MVRVVDAKYLGAHWLWIRFDDGTAGEADLASEMWGEVFEPLRDLAYFAQFSVGETRTVSWPNGADFAPEFLHALVVQQNRAARAG